MAIKQNIAKNGISYGLQLGIKILDSLFLVPFFISSWGVTYYGEWLTVSIIPSVLAFSDLGFGSAAANHFVINYVSGNKSEAANISKTGFIIITLVIVAGIILSGICLTMIVHFNWLKNVLIPTKDVILALSFIMTAKLLFFYTQLFDAYYRAARKAAFSINLLTINNVLNLVVGLTVILMGYKIVMYSFFQLIISILFICFYGWKAHLLLNLNKEYSGRFIKSEAKLIASKGFGYLMMPIWQIILFQGSTFVVRLTLGPVAVTVFNTMRTLTSSVKQLLSIISGSIFPELQYEFGAGKMDKVWQVFSHSIKLSFIISIIGVIFLVIFGVPLYRVWTHNTLTFPLWMWYIFLFAIIFNSIWWIAGVIFRVINKPYPLSSACTLSAIFAVGCSYFLCSWIGLTGAAIGILLFEMIMLLYVLPKSCKLLGHPVKQLFRLRTDLLKIRNFYR